MDHLRVIWSGFAGVFAGFQPRRYAQLGSFKQDAERLGCDLKRLGDDFTKSANTVYGKTTTATSKKY
ncbi:MAG: hypothetical protein ACRCYV_10080 [Aeromonas sp.]